jgi:hypothetical protein
MRFNREQEVLESVFVEMDPILHGFRGVLVELVGGGGGVLAPGDRRRHGQPPLEVLLEEPRVGLRVLRGRAPTSEVAHDPASTPAASMVGLRAHATNGRSR